MEQYASHRPSGENLGAPWAYLLSSRGRGLRSPPIGSTVILGGAPRAATVVYAIARPLYRPLSPFCECMTGDSSTTGLGNSCRPNGRYRAHPLPRETRSVCLWFNLCLMALGCSDDKNLSQKTHPSLGRVAP